MYRFIEIAETEIAKCQGSFWSYKGNIWLYPTRSSLTHSLLSLWSVLPKAPLCSPSLHKASKPPPILYLCLWNVPSSGISDASENSELSGNIKTYTQISPNSLAWCSMCISFQQMCGSLFPCHVFLTCLDIRLTHQSYLASL